MEDGWSRKTCRRFQTWDRRSEGKRTERQLDRLKGDSTFFVSNEYVFPMYTCTSHSCAHDRNAGECEGKI